MRSPLQEVGSGRNEAMLWALGWEEGVSQQCEAREAGAKSPLQHNSARKEGTGGAGTLGEESLRRPDMPPSRDWCVPH